ncbi:MAG TPA: flagellar M-ring protein FliF C-terminal domain-containing protein [Candidatus Binatia bacterium]|nr:flagellar M-ring protein FliF C-terminal domain-containing protein [Candidatus Binatia bacterium]
MLALAQLLTRWNALSRVARFAASGVAIAVIAVAIGGVFLGHASRAALFAQPLHSEQLSEVEERLAGWNVAFTPTSDNVIVDAARRNDLLLRLSLAGVPHQHLFSTGEAMAGIGVLTPQSVVDAQTRAGLSGDIEAGLRGIDGVDDARVIVAPGKPAEFADEAAADTSASVRLRLRTGTQLSHEAVAGIRAFVAASVPQLLPSRVTILDDRGVALADDPRAGDAAADLQRSLQSALDGAFGDGASIVRVRAEYDGTQYSEHDVRRAPVSAQAIAAVRRSESYDASGKRYRHVEQGEDRGSETRELVSRVAAGAIKRVSTAVFVDETRALDLAKVRELAAAAVGYDARRGDTLAVEAVDFRRALVARKDAWWLLYGTIVPLAPAVILTLGLVACTRLALPPVAALIQELAERAILARASKDAEGFAPGRVRSMLEREPPHAAAAIISALPAATASAVLELYPLHEREAIVSRMQRRHSPLLEDAQELLRPRA